MIKILKLYIYISVQFYTCVDVSEKFSNFPPTVKVRKQKNFKILKFVKNIIVF